jgi:hypothetical protein|nr:MAG TPA: hypothetical protein [Caudoviricetes sp.]DAT99473.1 MAG TPA: hypothetical protein [Caudoviricetes sp.]
MIIEIADNLIHVVILDISGVYVQIHNDGYFDRVSLDNINEQYKDKSHWRIVII